MGGGIAVASEEGRGSEFRVTLPVAGVAERARPDPAAEAPGQAAAGPGAGWRVLVDSRVPEAGDVIVGSGVRRSKIELPGELLATMPGAEVVDGMALG